jgi:hypothetical protein
MIRIGSAKRPERHKLATEFLGIICHDVNLHANILFYGLIFNGDFDPAAIPPDR